MVKVINISIQEHTFISQFKKPDAATKQCLKLLSEKQLLQTLPNKSKYIVRFTLDQTNSSLAGALRRVLVDEIPTYAMGFNLMINEKGDRADFISDLRTDDKYIFGKCDSLLKRIEAIRIQQNIDPNEWQISLNVINNTTELMDIYSSHFNVLHKGKAVDVSKLMFPNYILTRLRPQKHLTITNIRIDRGLSSINSNKFKYLANTYYEIDTTPLSKINGKFTGRSCMESDYTKFFMGYATYRNISAYEPIKRACEVLTVRLMNIHTEWNKIKKNEPSDKINKYQIGEIHVIEISDESYTMANLLFYYIYKEMPSIEFATGGIKHIEKNIAVIKIKHNNYWDLFNNAVNRIIDDLKIIANSFKKFN